MGKKTIQKFDLPITSNTVIPQLKKIKKLEDPVDNISRY